MLQRYLETYFFTSTILNWNHLLAHEPCKQIILDSLSFLVREKRIFVLAFVIMPNHQHLIRQIREGHELPDVQRDFLKYTAQQMKFHLRANYLNKLEAFRVNAKDREYQFWERNPLSIPILNESVFQQKLSYIHNNPTAEKWKLSRLPEEYKYSSAKILFDRT